MTIQKRASTETGAPQSLHSTQGGSRGYKALQEVERGFRDVVF
jgi:hypothetical protein